MQVLTHGRAGDVGTLDRDGLEGLLPGLDLPEEIGNPWKEHFRARE